MKSTASYSVLFACLLSYSLVTQAQPALSTMPIQNHERAVLFPSKSLIKQGQGVAETACVACHGMDGISLDPEKPNLAGQRAIYMYRILKAYQANTRTDPSMQHASGFLNDEALLSVSAYYASLPPARRPVPSEDGKDDNLLLDEDPFIGIRPAMKKCVRCHGETGNSSAPGMPSLTGQDPEYFITSMQSYVNGERDHRMMKRLVEKLEAQAIGEMGIFYAVQEPRRSESGYEGDPEAGALLAEDCVDCHGVSGNANGSDMPTLAGQDARYFVKAMNAYMDGERQHQAMFNALDGLSESDFQNLAAYYAQQEPLKRNIRKPFTSAEWIDRCERCHGIGGNSNNPRFPMLAGQNEMYLAKALMAYSSTDRSNTTMHAMSAPLSQPDIERIAKYYALQEPKSVVYMELPCNEAGE